MAISHKKPVPRAQLRRTPARDAKQADLAGPGIGDYTELAKVLPTD